MTRITITLTLLALLAACAQTEVSSRGIEEPAFPANTFHNMAPSNI